MTANRTWLIAVPKTGSIAAPVPSAIPRVLLNLKLF
jgi:hypothetical protein